jgi:PPOX class probable F420-dependent enzyme
MKIPQSVRDEIAKGPLAHLTTLNKDGSPQVTVIWVGIEGEEFVIGHLALHQKIKNIRRDPRVALSFIGQNTSKEGMREYVVAYGRARITEGGAVPLLRRLAPIYLGPGAVYPPASMQNIAGYLNRITPDRFSGIGPWAAKSGE